MAQEQEERQNVQDVLMTMQNDIMRIRDQQSQGQSMLEYLSERVIATPNAEINTPQSPSKSISVQVEVDKEKAEREEAEAFYEEPKERYNDFEDGDNVAVPSEEEEEVYDQIGLLGADDLRALIESEGIETTDDQGEEELRDLLITLMNSEEQDEAAQTAPQPTAVPTKPVEAPESKFGRVTYAEYMDTQSNLI